MAKQMYLKTWLAVSELLRVTDTSHQPWPGGSHEHPTYPAHLSTGANKQCKVCKPNIPHSGQKDQQGLHFIKLNHC